MSNSRLVKICISMLGMLLALQLSSANASDYGIFPAGSAAVTAFSGTLNSASDDTIFDSDGPSVRIITLPDSNPYGLRDTAKPFTVFNHDVGQVFGIAVDNASQPNIYVAATSAYGLAIYKPGQGRLKQGAPEAQFMLGQFGPGGGPNSIWRIDGKTGKVTLFASVVYSGIADAPGSLGALAFDAVTHQLFVSDRSSGMIHRFSMNGVERGIYDHGVEGLGAAGLPTVSYDPTTIANITLPNFDVEKPETWGYAPLARRVFALAVHDQRLYYSVYGSQIWSVGLASDGSFIHDARLELDIPALLPDTEIASIAFDQAGYLYIAERGAPTGDYHFINVANSGQNRVKRFSPKIPDNFSPYYWKDPGSEYSIGMYPEYQNSDGGVALTCGRNIWMTGDRLLEDGSFFGGFSHIDGLQGNDKSLVKPANMPPSQSWFVNYYDGEADSNSRGHMGAMVTRTICGGPGYRYGVTSQTPPLGLIPPLCVPRIIFWFGCNCLYDNGTTPPQTDWLFPVTQGCNAGCYGYGFPGFYDSGFGFEGGFGVFGGFGGFGEFGVGGFGGGVEGGFGFNFSFGFGFSFGSGFGFGPGFGLEYGYDGYCTTSFCLPIYVTCYPYCFPYEPEYLNGGFCYPGTCTSVFGCCPPEYRYHDGECLPPNTSCPPGQTYHNGECVPTTPPRTPPTTPPRTPPQTPPETTCPSGQSYYNGRCLTPPNTTCRNGQVYRQGHCITPPTTTCNTNQRLINGRCVTICGTGQRLVNGICITAPFCGTNYRYVNGKCVPICGSNQQLINGKCITLPLCGKNQKMISGRCVTLPSTVCGKNQRLVNGHCITIQNPETTKCGRGQILRNGYCVTAPSTQSCAKGQVMRYGRCVTIPTNTQQKSIYQKQRY